VAVAVVVMDGIQMMLMMGVAEHQARGVGLMAA